MPRRPAELSPGAPGLAPLVLASLAVLVAAADTYVVVLALPDILAGVGLTLTELQKATPIISAFLLGYVAVLPLIGRIADLEGRVPVLVGCLLLFAAGSLVTATSHHLASVSAGRLVQGVGAGGLVPATLALVADRYPPQRRGTPLGLVGAAQELGALVGPLLGAAVLLVASWRGIFWLNLGLGMALAVALTGRRLRRPHDLPGVGLALALLVVVTLALVAPASLVGDLTVGAVFVPVAAGSAFLSPLALAGYGLAALFALRELTAPRPLLALRRLPAVAGAVDLPGALLVGGVLAGVVLAFAAADPQRQVVSDHGPWLLAGSGALAAGFVLRVRRARRPLVELPTLRDRAAWGSLLVNLLVGAALMAALVDVPVFARVTRYPDSQLGAALVLVRLLAGVPVGAVAGGWLAERLSPRVTAAAGAALAAVAFLAMSRWSASALSGWSATVWLVVAGLGFGLVIAPVNAALLRATPARVHGLATGLVVVARTVGQLVGLALLTAIGLHAYYRRAAGIPSPVRLCPASPADCPAYTALARAAVVHELDVVFLGAAVCAGVAAVLALGLLRRAGVCTPPVR